MSVSVIVNHQNQSIKMAKYLKILSLLNIILLLILCFDVKSNSAQIYRQTSDGFNVDVG